MLEKANRIRLLIRKYLAGDLSVKEKVELDSWLSRSEENQKLLESFSNDQHFDKLLREYSESAKATNTLKIPDIEMDQQGMVVEVKKMPVLKWVAVASILFVAGVSIYYLVNERTNSELSESTRRVLEQQPEVMPANRSAILVLDDGSKVVLDSAGNGVIASNGGKEIVKQEGQLSYQGHSKVVVYNTLVTSKGKVMNLQLADGSRVWLNAESSIRFPTEFPGNERKVEVTGEVNFEVTRNARKPFQVMIQTSAGQKAEVEVLGTHFNVNAYGEETSIQTTLMEGSVKVSEFTNNSTRTLIPGQQAAIDKTGDITIVNNVNTDAVIAWKERNFFHFRNYDVKAIMRQLARWYDISVKYEGNLLNRTFSGQVSRELSLSSVLKMLEQANVRFSMNGREVTVKE